MRVRSYFATDVGCVRSHNEDAYLDLNERGLYAVADGMGGHAAGEVASRIAVAVLAARAKNARMGRDFLGAAFREVNTAILDSAARHPERFGMGTTMTACAVVGSKLHVAHVGDSACFLVRGEKVKKITRDHHGPMGSLTNCLGGTPGTFSGADLVEVDLVSGDTIVLATDGLTGYLDEDLSKLAIFTAPGLAIESADLFVAYALESGGRDNVTVGVIRVE